jgi:site-specific DNA-methyltransferase (adenine-specific)
VETYDVILADCPWPYKKWNKDSGHGKANDHYPTLTVKQLIAFGPQVQALAAPNAAIFFWVTPPTIEDGMKVLTSWGFEYKTFAFTWVKHYSTEAKFELGDNPMVLGEDNKLHKVAFGMGSYTRANAEPCLLGIRGRMPVADRAVSSIILSSRLSHSEKPAAQYSLIERLYPNARKLELFARHRRNGWHTWGNEVTCDVELVVP